MSTLGEKEGTERTRKQQRLRVDGLQEERHREDSQVEDGTAGAVRAKPRLGDQVEGEKDTSVAASERTIPATT